MKMALAVNLKPQLKKKKNSTFAAVLHFILFYLWIFFLPQKFNGIFTVTL